MTTTLPLAGIELGGTKCVCTLADATDILAQETLPTASPNETLAGISRVLDKWAGRGGFAALGIASFGPLDLDPDSRSFGFITATTKPDWSNTDVARRLAAPFGVPMAIDTDVNGAALAEMRWGSGRGMADFAYVTVGTGIGVGLIVNGRPVHGLAHPELGHVRVVTAPGDEWPGSCSFHGRCAEGLASGTAIKARLGGRPVGDVADDDPLWDHVAFVLGQLCHTIVTATAPRRIAIGGGVMQKQPHLLARIEPLLRDSLGGYLSLPEAPYLVAPGLSDLAGPLGSIALAQEALDRR